MDDADEDERYPQKHYSLNHHSVQSTSRSKLLNRSVSYPHQIRNEYAEEEDDDEGEDSRENDGFDDDDGEEDELNGENDGEEEDEEQNGYDNVIEDDDDDEDDDGRYQKKRKLKNLVSDYEFAPRVNVVKPTFNVRSLNSGGNWSEQATSVLLESWGDRYLQLGRRSLRSEDWVEVAEKVSEECKIEKSEIECRNHLDILKKKYKKEKEKEKLNGSGSKWAYFKKMDMLMTSSGRQQMGLPCGVDAGEYVFMNPGVYLDRSNGLDEMRDSPGESESSKAEEDDSDGPPPKKTRGGGDEDEGSSFRVLADSIQKFGEIYEKIENSKRQQMMELEKMRMDFHRELDLQKKQILERAQAEIAKIRQGEDEDTDLSDENPSG